MRGVAEGQTDSELANLLLCHHKTDSHTDDTNSQGNIKLGMGIPEGQTTPLLHTRNPKSCLPKLLVCQILQVWARPHPTWSQSPD